MKNVTITVLLKELKSMTLCNGIPKPHSRARDHLVQQDIDVSNIQDGCQPQQKVYHRSKDCAVFVDGIHYFSLFFLLTFIPNKNFFSLCIHTRPI
eukprot:UN11217